MRLLLGVVLPGLLLVFSLPQRTARAQSGYDLLGSGRTSALGYASAGLGTTAGLHANPAASVAHGRRLVSFYVRQAFGLTELRYGAGFLTLPREWGVLSGGASTFGNADYREVHYSLGYARDLQIGTTRPLYAGGLIRYYHTRIDGYGTAGAFGLHVGFLLTILPSLQFGAQATNLNGPSLGDENSLPQTLEIGLRYRATRRLSILFDVFKDVAHDASLQSGLEIRPIPMLALRAGMTTAPTRFTSGVGLRFGSLRAHLAAEQHAELGWSPSASLEIQW